MTRGLADLFNIVRTNAFLNVSGARIWGGNNARQIRHERNHPGDGEHHCRIVAHKRGRGYDRVSVLLEKVEVALRDVRGFHRGTAVLV